MSRLDGSVLWDTKVQVVMSRSSFEIEDLANFLQSRLEGRIRDILDRLSLVDGQAGQFRGALA
jgi:hypothetical protein